MKESKIVILKHGCKRYQALQRHRVGEYPPINIYFFSGDAFSEGVQITEIRDKVGMDTIREAMDMYKTQFKPKP